MDKITSMDVLQHKLDIHSKYYLLIHKSSSEVSQCAVKHIEDAVGSLQDEAGIGEVDVVNVQDIHVEFQVESAPSLLVFENKKLGNVIKGCMDLEYYKGLFSGDLRFKVGSVEDGKRRKNVIVYTTPSCSWCTKIKQHLNTNNIRFQEVDVAADPVKAEEMKRKSGQMGVPQTEIDGQMIVGFDRPKIDRLLEIA